MRTVGPLVLLAAALLGGTACMPVAHTWDEVEEFPIRVDTHLVGAPSDPDQLRVMTWNLKFGAGRLDFFFDGWGERVHMTEDEVRANLDGILALLEEQQPDILLTQEVEVGSTRSAYVDMVQVILEETDYDYAAWVPNWEVDWIPQEGLGKVKMGQAVFSRWPIVRNTRVGLPESEANSALVSYFLLHRAIQVVEVDLGERVLTVVNNHPEAYALDGTKQAHLAEILAWSDAAFPPVVTGGDLNVIPPGSIRTEGFADDAPSDTPGVTSVSYAPDEMDALLPFYERYDAAIDLETYQAADTEEAQQAFFTHSISGEVFWTQKLDYLFTTERWTGGWTLQQPGDGSPPLVSDPMRLSDHAPVVGDLDLAGMGR